uniref:Endo/exonuclease/phosphatase domain-containing protein n=1 Tax=Anopheles atroparvus TaxID=41427 RepID=A0A182J429_ANOAO
MNFNSSKLNFDASFEVSLKGLRFGTPQQVKALLEEAGLTPVSVRLPNFVRTNWASKVFVISFAKGTTSLQKLREISQLQLTRVYWDKYLPPKKDVTQCFKCLRFGHGATNCAMAPRCRKCGGAHPVKRCAVELYDKLRCANCMGMHSPFNRHCRARIAFLQKHRGPAKAPTNQPASTPLIEAARIEVSTSRGCFHLFAVYCPRQARTRDGTERKDLHALTRTPGDFVIAGDLNARHRQWGNERANKNGAILKSNPCHATLFYQRQQDAAIRHMLAEGRFVLDPGASTSRGFPTGQPLEQPKQAAHGKQVVVRYALDHGASTSRGFPTD